MFRSSKKTRRHLPNAAAPRARRPRFRRLSIEAMESRLLLSGNQASGDLDYSIWNLDSLQTNYAIISQGDSLPRPSTSTSSAAGPSGADLDVSWVAVPDMLLSAGDAQKLANQQYREAMSQGIINFQQSSALYQQLQAGFSSDAGSTLVPVYTIGIRNHSPAPVVGGLTDFFSDSSSHVSDVHIDTTIPLTSSFGSTGSLLNLGTTPTPSTSPPAGLAEDVISTGDFNRDGIVNAMDYSVWRDSVSSSNALSSPSSTLAYNNWRTNFGRSVAEFTKVGDTLKDGLLGSDLAVDHDGVLDPQPTITIDVTHTSNLVTTVGTPTAGIDLIIRMQDDTFSVGTPSIVRLDPVDSSIVWLDPVGSENEYLLSFNGTSAGPVTIAAIEDAESATSGPTSIVNVGDGSSQLIVSTPPAKIETSSPQQSTADEELDQAIDELLADDDTIIASPSDDTSSQAIADGTPADAADATDVAATDVTSGDSTDSQSPAGDSAEAATANQLAEGGMISIDQIVDAATGDATATSNAEIAATGEASELVGELSRVAVMELIEGEPEPDAPQGSDTSTLVADSATESPRAVQIVTEQAGLAITLVSPVNPAYLASFASAASQAFAAVVNSELSAQLSDAARGEAFSQWGNESSDQFDTDEADPAAAHASNRWLDAVPLIVALACERTVAARNKRRQRTPDRQPVKAK